MPTGPSLEPLLRRLMETPPDFLDPPLQSGSGRVHVAAVVNDVLASHGCTPPMSLLATLSGTLSAVSDNQLTLAAVMAWLLADETWRARGIESAALPVLFSETVPALAAEAKATRYVLEPDRREELARTVIARLAWSLMARLQIRPAIVWPASAALSAVDCSMPAVRQKPGRVPSARRWPGRRPKNPRTSGRASEPGTD